MSKTLFSPERAELNGMRESAYAREAYAAFEHLQRTEPMPDRVALDFQGDDGTPTRQGVCLCCGERRNIPVMWHVCLGCHAELEEER